MYPPSSNTPVCNFKLFSREYTVSISKYKLGACLFLFCHIRMIFYADGDAGYIYQATLTGDNHQVLTGAKTTNPTALVVDAVSKVLYWLDEGTQYLQSWNYVNSEFKKIWNSYKVGVGVFTGIDIYEASR